MANNFIPFGCDLDVFRSFDERQEIVALRRCLSIYQLHPGRLVAWCNHHHQHSGIGFHTPTNVHYDHAAGMAKERSAILAAARARHPERFTTTEPKILALPGPASINQPKEVTEQSAAKLPVVPLSLKNSGAAP
ncbi:hypothetical protein [Arthrobacter sp. H16F315]|uniref:hypothetical protein n=1 Tax=Arthrobacter sp. H16F315 TaxID=2955314 RepID=UPI00406CE04C